MSLKTRFGNTGNILDFENLTKDNIYVLEGPVLSNSQFEKLYSGTLNIAIENKVSIKTNDKILIFISK